MKCIVSVLAACGLVMVVGCKRVAVEADTPEPPKKAEDIQYLETDAGQWPVHDTERPAPTVVTPGAEPGQARMALP